MNLVGNASTQSRGRRPAPDGWSGQTLKSIGVWERVRFVSNTVIPDATDVWEQDCLSWVVGQAGLLWGSGPWPHAITRYLGQWETPGSYGHAYEHELCEALEKVYGPLWKEPLAARFFANGSDACAAAARLARAVTGRTAIASYGYHGSHLDFAHAPSVRGVPKEVVDLHRRFEFGDVIGLMQATAVGERAAAVIVEVPPEGTGKIKAFLQACRRLCDDTGALLVIDDVVLGFRVALGGSLERYGVIPDMVVLGKAMSAVGGVAAVVGRAKIVNLLGTAVFYSTTFGGQPTLCKIAAATIDWLRENESRVYGPDGHLEKIGSALMDGLNEIGRGRYAVMGQPTRSVAVFADGDEARRKWCGRMIAGGVIVDRPFFPTLAHTINDVALTLRVAREIA